MPLFAIELQTPSGSRPMAGLVEFAAVEDAYCDVCSAIPDAAADLLRRGTDPMACAYVIRNQDGVLLLEVPFAELVRTVTPALPRSAWPTRTERPEPTLLAWAEASRRSAERVRQRSEEIVRRSRAMREHAMALLAGVPVVERASTPRRQAAEVTRAGA